MVAFSGGGVAWPRILLLQYLLVRPAKSCPSVYTCTSTLHFPKHLSLTKIIIINSLFPETNPYLPALLPHQDPAA